MRRFAFALQPVLDHRQRIEEQKQLVVAARLRALDEAETELRRLNDEFRRNADHLRTNHTQFATDELRAHYAHMQFLDRTIIRQITVVAERRVALDRARADLLAASKARKVVDTLKERRRDAFATEERRLEQNDLDDTNARRHGRTLRQAGGIT